MQLLLELEKHLLWYGTAAGLAREVLLGHAPQVGLAAKLLKDSGDLTQSEFDRAKRRLLGVEERTQADAAFFEALTIADKPGN